MKGRFAHLVAEMRRRRVVRVLGAYTAAALAVIYAADAILPRLTAPDWTVTAIILVAALGLPIAIGLSWAFDVTADGIVRMPPAGRDAERSDPRPDLCAIAVLPFASLSDADGSDYFCDGISEEIINALAQLPDLRVVGRTSAFAFKGRQADLREIGRQLCVGTVVEGSVRRMGDRVRITAQLIQAADGYHLWSARYDRELHDIFAVQEDIARQVTAHLAVRLGVGVSVPARTRHPANPQAYKHYLRGRHHMAELTSAGFQRARAELEAALALEPDYALAHATLAECELMHCALFDLPFDQGAARAEVAARRALELDDNLAEAHAALGAVLTYYLMDWDAAERCFVRALDLSPGSAQTHTWYGDLLVFTRRYEEGLHEAQLAREIDPLSTLVLFNLLQNLVMMERHDEVKREAEEIRRLFPGAPFVDFFRAMSAWRAGRASDALQLFESAAESLERASHVLAFYAAACYTSGERARGDSLFEELLRRSESQYVSRGVIALVHVARAETERAIALLREARSKRENFVAQFRAALDMLPIEPEQALLDELSRMGFR